MNFYKFFSDRRNFYLTILIVGALLIAGSIWQYRNYVENKRAEMELKESLEDYYQNDQEQDRAGIQIIEEGTGETGAAEESVKEVTNTDSDKTQAKQQPVPKENQKEAKNNIEKAVPAMKVEEPNMNTMLSPVFGSVILEFSINELVYSKTLDLWTTHTGLDIKAEEGSPVRAAMSGTVESAENDPEWGMTIVLNHGNGIVTKYSNLSTLDLVKVGQKVQKGDVISGVGKSALYEVLEDAHLHFEVIKDGKHLDPKAYLPKQALNH